MTALPPASHYDALTRTFRWFIPPRFNIATAICDRWAETRPDAAAILEVGDDGAIDTTTFASLRDRANRLASALNRRGIAPGDRLAVLLPQGAAVMVAHLAALKLGAITLPLSVLFGPDALQFRLADAGARVVVTDAAGLLRLAPLRAALPDLAMMICVDGASGDALGFEALLAEGSPHFATADTGPDDPALMIYTSGTTGPPKGALHGHRVLLGHLPGFQMAHDLFPQAGDLMWTVSDWAWAGGLLNAIWPSLYFGVPVVARRWTKFDPEGAFDLMARLPIRNAVVPPTALRMMRTVERPRQRFDFRLRSVLSAGESLGAETFAWGREALGLTINEAYGQTECNLVIASSARLGVNRAGAIGRPVPGHDVRLQRPDGRETEPGEPGEITVRMPDPVMMLGYWNRPDATAEKVRDGWMFTGDRAVRDADGFIRFLGRDDDVITSAGYRIGPVEIEDCLLGHPAVALAAVVGVPDALRTEIVKAFVVLRPGVAASDALATALQDFVRHKLSAHEYPRAIAFVPDLPTTTTGKLIRRLLRDRA